MSPCVLEYARSSPCVLGRPEPEDGKKDKGGLALAPFRNWVSASTTADGEEVALEDVASTPSARSKSMPDLQFLPPTATAARTSARTAPLDFERLAARGEEGHWLIRREDLEIFKELGQTLHSIVYLAEWKGTTVVAKCAGLHTAGLAEAERAAALQEAGAADSMAQELLHEVEMLAQLRHPDLVLFLGACLDRGAPAMCLTEYMPRGDLERFYHLQRRKRDGALWRPALRDVVDWCAAVARALNFLHKRRVPVIHRDLKPMNLFLSACLELKVGDFGSSSRVHEADGFQMSGGVGTWRYMAPEMARHEVYSEKVDIYAFGLIIYFMSSGRMPFHQLGPDPQVILDAYVKRRQPRPKLGDCYKPLRPLMAAAWSEEPGQRPSAEDMLSSLKSDVSSPYASCSCGQM